MEVVVHWQHCPPCWDPFTEKAFAAPSQPSSGATQASQPSWSVWHTCQQLPWSDNKKGRPRTGPAPWQPNALATSSPAAATARPRGRRRQVRGSRRRAPARGPTPVLLVSWEVSQSVRVRWKSSPGFQPRGGLHLCTDSPPEAACPRQCRKSEQGPQEGRAPKQNKTGPLESAEPPPQHRSTPIPPYHIFTKISSRGTHHGRAHPSSGPRAPSRMPHS